MNAEPKKLRVKVPELSCTRTRVDSYIAEALQLFSRSQVKRRVVEVRVNGKPAKLSKSLHGGEELEILYTYAPEPRVEPQPMDLDILYEDSNVVVLHKPQGMVVHPGCGNWSGTLVNGLLHHCRQLAESFPGEPARPGIVHRLDRQTSGVIVTAKNPQAREFLSQQFRSRAVEKLYIAAVRGAPPAEAGRIDCLIGRDPRNRKRFACLEPSARGTGKRALTYYRVLRHLQGASLVALKPKTGRTHQLRVQMAHLGCPILGDSLYSRRSSGSLMLHAYRLRIRLPGEREPRTFRAPLPPPFRELLRCLKGS